MGGRYVVVGGGLFGALFVPTITYLLKTYARDANPSVRADNGDKTVHFTNPTIAQTTVSSTSKVLASKGSFDM